MGATFWSSPSGDLSCHFDPSPLGRELLHHDEVAGRWCSAPPPFLYFPFWSCAPLSPWTATHFTVSPLHSRLHRQQYSPTPVCFKQTVLPPPFWYPSMDWWFCPLPFWSRWCWSVCHMLQMQHVLFPVLLHWPNCLQLHSWNLFPQANLDWCTIGPLDYLQIPVSPFPNWLPIGPLNPFISPLLSPAWVPLEFLVPRLLPLQQNHLVLPMGLPGNENADLLAKAGASLPTDAIPCPLPPAVAKVRYFQHHNWRRHISHSYMNHQVPEVSSEELLFSRRIRFKLSRLRCHGHSLLLSSYLHRISRKENSACSACGHPLQDLNHLLLVCPASEPLRKSIFGSPLSILDVW